MRSGQLPRHLQLRDPALARSSNVRQSSCQVRLSCLSTALDRPSAIHLMNIYCGGRHTDILVGTLMLCVQMLKLHRLACFAERQMTAELFHDVFETSTDGEVWASESTS